MTPLRLLCLLFLCAAPGCTWIPYAVKNFAGAQCDMWTRVCLRARLRHEADAAWEQVLKCAGDVVYSDFYARGFREGFVEFLDADGTGEPPAAPPWRFRNHQFLTPEGRQEVEDWFAGYRHGAAVARASGLREMVVVPLALPPLHVTLGVPEMPPPPDGPVEVPHEPLPPEPLPAPRTLPAPDGKAVLETPAAGKQ
jgi:hypothetical protein